MTSAFATSILRNALCHDFEARNNQKANPMKHFYSKKLRATALILLAFLAFLPMTVIGQQTVYNFNDLRTELQAGRSVYLGSNIVLSEKITITSNRTPTIYGQGYTLSRNSTAKGFIKIAGTNARLTVSNVIFDGKGYLSDYAMIHCGVDADSFNNERLTLTNCTFKNCKKKGQTEGSSGAAINCHGSNVVLNCIGVNFISNINKDIHENIGGNVHGGGALAVCGGANFTLTNCNFYDNIAAESGGAIYLENCGNGTITDCNIGVDPSYPSVDRGNIAYIVGGGIYGAVGSGKTIQILGNTRIEYNRVNFDSNYTYLYDDPVYNYNNNVKFGDGGGIYFISSSSAGADSYLIIGDASGDKKVTISNNYARNGGGGLVMWCQRQENHFTLQNFEMKNNQADGETNSINYRNIGGGGMLLYGQYTGSHNADHLTIKNGIIEGNHSRYRGGGVRLYRHSCTIENVTFKDNYTRYTSDYGQGGGVYVNGIDGESQRTNIFKNCVFTGNGIQSGTTKTRLGGAIYATDNTNLQLLGCTVGGSAANANKASVAGGGIYIGPNSYLNMDTRTATSPITYRYMEVSYNQAVNGGGIYIANGSQGHSNIGSNSTSANKVQIHHNIATGSGSTGGMGGGIYLDCGCYVADQFTLTNFELTENTASMVGTNPGMGGGAYIKGTSVTGQTHDHSNMDISNGTVQNNSANHGGGIYFDHHDAYITNVVFDDHMVIGNGGAVYILGHSNDNDNPHQHEFDRCTFTSNRAMNGGAVYVYDHAEATFKGISGNPTKIGDYDIDDESSLGNTATGDGGGVFFGNHSIGIFENYCDVDHNTASVNGGGVYFSDYSYGDFQAGSTVTNNEASNGGGIYMGNSCEVVMDDAKVQNNKATTGDGGGIWVGDAPVSDHIEFFLKVEGIGNGSAGYLNYKLERNNGGTWETCTDVESNTVFTDATEYLFLIPSGSTYRIKVVSTWYNPYATYKAVYRYGNTNNETAPFAYYNNTTSENIVIPATNSTLTGLIVRNTTISSNNAINGNGGGVYLTNAATADFYGPIANKMRIKSNTAGNFGGGVYIGTGAIMGIKDDVGVYGNVTTRSGSTYDDYLKPDKQDDVCLQTLNGTPTTGNIGKIKVLGNIDGSSIGITEQQPASGTERVLSIEGNIIRQFTINYGNHYNAKNAFEVFFSNDKELEVILLRPDATTTPSTTTTTGILEVTLGEDLGTRWYVAGIVDDGNLGTGYTWGSDNNSGLNPDVPKRTLTGLNGVFAQTRFNPEKDHIFVVRAISMAQERVNTETNKVILRYPTGAAAANFNNPGYHIADVEGSVEIVLLRYPGGHPLSSDFPAGTNDANTPNDGSGTPYAQSGTTNNTLKPGPNIGPIVSMDALNEAKIYHFHLDGMSTFSGEEDPIYNPQSYTISPNSALLSVETGTSPITLKETCELLRNENKFEGSAISGRETRLGGGVYCAGTLTCDADTRILHNSSKSNGGGVYMKAGTATLNGTSIEDNKSNTYETSNAVNNGEGGGVYVEGGNATLCNNTIVANNTADTNGGGVYININGAVSVSDSQIHTNKATNGNGGGIYNIGSLQTLGTNAVTIQNNEARQDGGGIYDNGILLKLDNIGTKTFIKNKAGQDGGGIWTAGNKTLVIDPTSVSVHDLPLGYTQVEYLESESYNNHYINTGLTLNTEYTFDVIAAQPTTNMKGGIIYAGSNSGLGTGCCIYGNDRISYNWNGATGNISAGYISGAGIDMLQPFQIIQNKNGWTLYQGTNTFTLNYTSTPATSSDPIYLFGQQYFSGLVHVRIYEAKIYDADGTTVLRHFVPCRNSSGTLGMLDINNNVNQFYPNSGSGTFLAGEDVIPATPHYEDGVILKEIIMGSSDVNKNTAGRNGGGIYIDDDGVVQMADATITHNEANKGGGVYKLGSLKVEGSMTITDNVGVSNTTDNVYIINGSDNPYVEIIDALDCDSRIGVTKRKSGLSGYVGSKDLHTYEADMNSAKVGSNVRTLIAQVEPADPAETWAKDAFKNNVFFDDDDRFGVWSFNYNPNNNATAAYSDQKDYFIETWRTYADNGTDHVDNDGNGFVNKVKSPEGLSYFAKHVNSGNDYESKSVIQTTDIDLSGHYWEPIGFSTGSDCDPATDYQFSGSYNGNGHIITNAMSVLPAQTMGLFGNVDGGSVNRTFNINVDFTGTFDGETHIGGIAGQVTGTSPLIDRCEAQGSMLRYGTEDANTGGIVGNVAFSTCKVRNSFAVASTLSGKAVGGLVGKNAGFVENAYALENTLSGIGSEPTVGALVGNNANGTLSNAYTDNSSAKVTGTTGSIGNVYAPVGYTGGESGVATYTATIGADQLGYMYADNLVGTTPLFEQLTTNAQALGAAYDLWARPALAYYVAGSPVTIEKPINDDLPVLLMDNYDGSGNIGAGGFRTVSNYNGLVDVLQYGGPDRDGNQLDGTLGRSTGSDSHFIYGDISAAPAHTPITANRISIYEHAAITEAGTLGSFNKTHVSITFDNSRAESGNSLPLSTEGVNGFESQPLPRDWHIFSTPLRFAPLGFNYKTSDGTETNVADGWESGNTGTYANNPWAEGSEFSWLSGGRYWMAGWTTGTLPEVDGMPALTASGGLTAWTDGYFPSAVESMITGYNIGQGTINGTDENPGASGLTSARYPYGMDFYSWYEPEYHYINFKRNGPNHWHSDEPHGHLEYHYDNNKSDDDSKNLNETNLVSGKGYMASIAKKTLLQSSGALNGSRGSSTDPMDYKAGFVNMQAKAEGEAKGRTDEVSILATKNTNDFHICEGWNLVGNPFHAYLDFDAFCEGNSDKISDNTYLVYNADGDNGNGFRDNGSGFSYYVKNGSSKGAYASQYLHPHQGFFVKVGSTTELTFSESQTKPRSEIGTSGSFREDERPAYPLVNLFLTSEKGCSDVCVVEFNRPEWGGGGKLREIYSGNGLFYAYHDDKNYAALFATPEAERIPIKFEAKEPGGDTYTITWNTANGDFSKLYLVDNMTGVQYDMLAHDSYSFRGQKGDYWSRFYIVFDVTGVEEEQDEDQPVATTFAFYDGAQWVVTNDGSGSAILQLIDLQGRVLETATLANGQTRVSLPNVATGMYLLRMSTTNGTQVQKIIVR